MKRRILCFLLAALLCCGAASAARAESPYAIRVNRACNTVTVYSRDDSGAYTVPVKAMICSTARSGYVTPLGTFTLTDYRSRWCLMLDGSYGQYACSFSGNYMFHSVCYSEKSQDSLLYEEYNALGGPASMGCVRLQVADAKWIYDNCPGGTQVTVYADAQDPGPLGKPEKVLAEITAETNNGWDPTDPVGENPWNKIEVSSLTLSADALTLEAGAAQKLTAEILPAEAAARAVTWTSSNPAVAAVTSGGVVTALSAGTAEVTASCGGVSASCIVIVAGTLLPYDDLTPGAWYYPEVRAALSKGLFQGVGERSFAPDRAMTRAMLVQVLYNRAGKPSVTEPSPFSDVAEDAWYADAVAWAYGEGYVTGVSEDRFAPSGVLSREQLATILWRSAGSPAETGNLSAFSDGGKAASYAGSALVWMTSQGYLRGSGGKLSPKAPATRAETAAILNRMYEA